MADKTPFYITTAISYVNGSPHLGHAYEGILTDAMARFKRLDGHDVHFLTGTDEHGEKVLKTAKENNEDVQDFASKNTEQFREMTKLLGMSNDDFIRTTEDRHIKSSQAIWKKLQEKGDIYLDTYAGWYSIREEGYFTEDELVESDDGLKLAPNGTEVEWVEEGSYFFKLSEYGDKLLKYYEDHPEFIQPESRRNEIISFVKGGLRDLSVSRPVTRLPWGVPVPDNDLTDEPHVMYVWLDALTNYITAVGYPDIDSDLFKKFWSDNDEVYHVIGKDITRFHCVYWPAFLISAGIPLPKTVFAHGFINVQGTKMSKSLGNVLSPTGLVETYGLDQIRYFLLREIPHGGDGNFSHETAIQRMNADLANGVGNLAQRTLSMIYKNCDEAIPEPGEFLDDDKELLQKAQKAMVVAFSKSGHEFALHRALEAIMSVASDADTYVDAQAPWVLKKENPERMKTVLYVLAETVRCIAIALQFATPDGSAKILNQLKIPEDQRLFAHISPDYALKAGTAIDKPEGVFPRLHLEEAA
ncbi:MAG: methionine--tRNA ligase [Pseudomonadota bacterium]